MRDIWYALGRLTKAGIERLLPRDHLLPHPPTYQPTHLPSAVQIPTCLYPPACCACCRSLAAELARRLLELVGWLAGKVESRRLRAFQRAYFPLRRWHIALGEPSSTPFILSLICFSVAV